MLDPNDEVYQVLVMLLYGTLRTQGGRHDRTTGGKVSTYTLHGTCAKAVTTIRIYDYEVLNPKWARWLCYFTRKQAIQMQILL